MQIPGVHIETLYNPVRYTYTQIERLVFMAYFERAAQSLADTD